jgi:hypothetical protein
LVRVNNAIWQTAPGIGPDFQAPEVVSGIPVSKPLTYFVSRFTIAAKTVLVTGGAGFIGSYLVDRLLVEGAAHVVVIDNMFLGSEDNLLEAQATGKLSFYKDDAEFVSSLEYVFGRHPVDVVFNCATKALNYSFLNPANAFGTNVTVALNLLELQRRGAFSTLCHFSTSEVYGSAVYEPMDEQHPRYPTTTYAAGKAAADLAVESYVHMFGLDAFTDLGRLGIEQHKRKRDIHDERNNSQKPGSSQHRSKRKFKVAPHGPPPGGNKIVHSLFLGALQFRVVALLVAFFEFFEHLGLAPGFHPEAKAQFL